MEKMLSEAQMAAWARLIRVSGDLRAEAEADLKSAALPPLTWYDVLLELNRAGPDGLRPFQLQERILLAQYNLSRLIDRLVKAGYVVRLRSPEDGRGQVLTITEAGKSILENMWPVYRAAISKRFAEKLSDAEIRSLTRILGKLRD